MRRGKPKREPIEFVDVSFTPDELAATAVAYRARADEYEREAARLRRFQQGAN